MKSTKIILALLLLIHVSGFTYQEIKLDRKGKTPKWVTEHLSKLLPKSSKLIYFVDDFALYGEIEGEKDSFFIQQRDRLYHIDKSTFLVKMQYEQEWESLNKKKYFVKEEYFVRSINEHELGEKKESQIEREMEVEGRGFDIYASYKLEGDKSLLWVRLGGEPYDKYKNYILILKNDSLDKIINITTHGGENIFTGNGSRIFYDGKDKVYVIGNEFLTRKATKGTSRVLPVALYEYNIRLDKATILYKGDKKIWPINLWKVPNSSYLCVQLVFEAGDGYQKGLIFIEIES